LEDITPASQRQLAFTNSTAPRHKRFATRVHVDPLRRSATMARVTLVVPDMLQRWTHEKSVAMRLPGINVTQQDTLESLYLRVGVALRNGTRLVNPVVTFYVENSNVPVDWSQGMEGCNVSNAEYLVRCSYPEVTLNSDGTSQIVATGAQAVVPPYYANDVNITVAVSAVNAPTTRTTYTMRPMNPVIVRRVNVTSAPSSQPNVFVAGIFNQTEGIIHFLVFTFAAFFLALIVRTLWYVYRRRYNREISFSVVDIPVWQALIKHHVLVGLLWPCHYRCANVHITLFMCCIMTMYSVVAIFYAATDHTHMRDVDFHIIVGVTAALVQAAIRPILGQGFYWFRVHDDQEMVKAIEMEEKDLSDDLLAPAVYDAFDAFGKEEPDDILAPTSGFDDADLLVDDALRMNAPAANGAGEMQFDATFGDFADAVANLDANEGMDWNQPVDLDDDILIMGDDEVNESDGINPDDIEFAFDATSSGTMDAPEEAQPAGGLDDVLADDIDFGAMLDDESDHAASPLHATSSASPDLDTANSFGDNTMGWQEGDMSMRPLDKRDRGKTIANLNMNLEMLDDLEDADLGSTIGSTVGSADMTGTTDSFNQDDSSTDAYSGIIVTRHLGNMRFTAYVVAAVYIVLCAVLTWWLTNDWASAQLNHFWITMATAAAINFCIVEFLYVGLVFLYRWLINEDEDDAMNELHPYEGEEEVRIY